MKVFIYDNPNELNNLFGEPDYRVPFLSTNLLNFATMGILRNAAQVGEGHTIYIPDWWSDISNISLYSLYTNVAQTLEAEQSREYELVFLMSLFSVMVGDFSKEDIAFLKQNPGKLYQNNGVIGGYLEKEQAMPAPEDFEGFDAFWQLTPSSYLRINQQLVGQLSLNTVKADESNTIYGAPALLSSSVQNSTICAPSYISENSTIVNSYIAPGSIVTGDVTISGSKVFGSFVNDANIINSVLTDSIVSGSVVDGLQLKESIIPQGSLLQNERQV